ncbi:uncharacterized protein JCM15063_002242 [Sporobolomyces koalae]|uniref:uncharacterized protein n=1 Tax=Sporobolomyces koalae TaxID=500713 RepID=UPI0031716B31
MGDTTPGAVELVPDTPTCTAGALVETHDSTYDGESYLEDLINPHARTPHVQGHLSETGDVTSSPIVGGSKQDTTTEPLSFVQPEPDLSIRTATAKDDHETVIRPGNRRRSNEGDVSTWQSTANTSAAGYLGAQTQPQTLAVDDTQVDLVDEDMSLGQTELGSIMVASLAPEKPAEAAGDKDQHPHGQSRESISMDVEEIDQLASTDGEEMNDGPRPSTSRESQKENATAATRSTRLPSLAARSSVQHALRDSGATLEPPGSAPSSSTFVVQQLLHRSPLKGSAQSSKAQSSSRSLPDLGRTPAQMPKTKPEDSDSSRPLTSTPGKATTVFPPAPAPTQAMMMLDAKARSTSAYQFEPAATDPTSQARSNVSLRATKTAPGLVPDLTLFGSSAAMAKPIQKGKRKKEEWDGISQDTPEEILRARSSATGPSEVAIATQAQDLESAPLSPTQVHVDGVLDESLLPSVPVQCSNVPPKPTAERTIDMDIDEGDSSNRYEDGHGGTLDKSTLGGIDDSFTRGDLRTNTSSPARPQPVDVNTFTSSTSSSPSNSPGARQMINSSAPEPQDQAKRLSEISGFKSSQDFPPTQFEVEATQKVYDVEKSQLSINSIDMDITNSSTWHAPFAHDESTTSSYTRQRANQIPGRELRRVAPAPTPLVNHHEAPTPSAAAEEVQHSLGDSTPPLAGPEKYDEPASLPPRVKALPFAEEIGDSVALPVPPKHLLRSPHKIQVSPQVIESSPDIPLSKIRQSGPFRSPSRLTRTANTPSSNDLVVPDSEGPTQSQDHPDDRQSNQSVSGRDSDGSLTDLDEDDAANEIKIAASSKRMTIEPRLKSKQRVGTKRARRTDYNEGELSDGVEKASKKTKGPGRQDQISIPQKTKVNKQAGKVVVNEEAAIRAESSDLTDQEVNETHFSDMPNLDNPRKPSPVQARASKRVKIESDASRPSRRKAIGPAIVESSDEDDLRSPQAEWADKIARARLKRSNAASPDKNKTRKKSSTIREPTKTRSPRSIRPVAESSRLRYLKQAAEDTASVEDDDDRVSDTKPSVGSKLLASAPFSRCFGLWRDDGYYYPGTITHVTKEYFNVRFDDGSNGRLKSHEIRRCVLEPGDWFQFCGSDKGDSQVQIEVLQGDFRVMRVQRGTSEESIQGEQLDGPDTIVAVSAQEYGRSEMRSRSFLVEAIRILRARAVQFDNRKLKPSEIDAFEGRNFQNVKRLPLMSPPTRPDVTAFEEDSSKWGLFARTAFLVTEAGSKHSSELDQKQVKQTDKDRFIDKLRARGATIIEWEHLFEARIDSTTGCPHLRFPRAEFADIDTILLLADRPTTTMKFLIALALGIPCCSTEFAQATIKEGTRIDWEPYLLPAGTVESTKFYGIGGQLRALRKPIFDLESLALAQSLDGLFKDQSFLVITERAGKGRDEKLAFNRHAYMILSLLACCSANRIDFLTLPFDTTAPSKPVSTNPSNLVTSASIYTHIFLDFDESNTKLELAIKPLVQSSQLRGKFVNMNWIKQCLISGKLDQPDRTVTRTYQVRD